MEDSWKRQTYLRVPPRATDPCRREIARLKRLICQIPQWQKLSKIERQRALAELLANGMKESYLRGLLEEEDLC